MQQLDAIYSKIPTNSYYSSKEEKKEKFYQNETHIHKQGPLTGIKVSANKLYNDIFTYFPKGFEGSKNSDFYEFLSLGYVPYLVGSIAMIGSYTFANSKFGAKDANYARKAGKMAGMGVILYGLSKLVSKKLSRTLIHASTGVNLDKKYLNKAYEIPEDGQEAGIVRTQYPGVFDSSEFPRFDLLKKDAQLNHDNENYYNDKIAKKVGYKEKLNAPEQLANKKMRELKVRSTAMENILCYIPAAFGVALGAQNGFAGLKWEKLFSQHKFDKKALIHNLKNPLIAFKESCKQLWNGNSKNFVTRNFGKAMIIGAGLATVLNWLVPTIAFKTKPDTLKSKVDSKKEYEVC